MVEMKLSEKEQCSGDSAIAKRPPLIQNESQGSRTNEEVKFLRQDAKLLKKSLREEGN